MKVVYIQHNRFRVSWIRQRKLKKIDAQEDCVGLSMMSYTFRRMEIMSLGDK